jgi:hypothetical protein
MFSAVDLCAARGGRGVSAAAVNWGRPRVAADRCFCGGGREVLAGSGKRPILRG